MSLVRTNYVIALSASFYFIFLFRLIRCVAYLFCLSSGANCIHALLALSNSVFNADRVCFCQFCRTTWTLLLVVSLLLLQDSGTLLLWTVELLHLLTHLRPGLRHFSLLRHNPHCSTRICTMARYKCIDWLIDWLIVFLQTLFFSESSLSCVDFSSVSFN